MMPVGLMSARGLHVLDRVPERLVIDQVVGLALEAELLAQGGNARVLVARLDAAAVRDAVVGSLGARAAAQFGELGLERTEAVMRRVETVERRVKVAGVGDLLENVGRFGRVVAVVDFRRHARRRDAADRQMARMSEDRIGHLDIGVGQRFGTGQAGEFRHRIIRRVERVGRCIFQMRDRRLGLRSELAAANPQRRVAARGVEAFHRLTLRLAIDAASHLLGAVAQLVGDGRVAGGELLVERALGLGSVIFRFNGRGRHSLRRRLCRLRARLGRRSGALDGWRRVIGGRRHGGRFAAARCLTVERRRHRADRLQPIGRCDRDRRCGDDCGQHGAGQQSLETLFTHRAQLHTQRHGDA